MVLDRQRVTVEEFERFVALPENADKLFELIGGEIVEMPSNAFASAIGYNIGFPIKLFLRENNIKGHVTGEAGGYVIAGERYAPDVAYISAARQPQLAREGYNPNPPEFAAEVDFPSTLASQRILRTKIASYLAAGTLLWLVYPEAQEVEVFAPGQPMRLFGINDVLDGGEVLPGFTLPVQVIFEA
ncbi:MAG: Uma2 family endonuclease [Anaerolineae bacterium]